MGLGPGGVFVPLDSVLALGADVGDKGVLHCIEVAGKLVGATVGSGVMDELGRGDVSGSATELPVPEDGCESAGESDDFLNHSPTMLRMPLCFGFFDVDWEAMLTTMVVGFEVGNSCDLENAVKTCLPARYLLGTES